MTERAERKIAPREFYISEMRVLNAEGARVIAEEGLELASSMGLSGFLTVYSRTGMQECSQAIGFSATPTNVDVANAKIKTVLAMRRSSRLQRERMEANGQSREDFGGQLGSLFGGGVAIFADEGLEEFVGAVAFSGGTQTEDEEIVRSAVESVGLYTDIKPLPETAD